MADKRVHIRITTKLVEDVSAAVHEQWMLTKREQGVTSRLSESGEELVPYADLSQAAKDLDRGTVHAVLAGLRAAGYYGPLSRRAVSPVGDRVIFKYPLGEWPGPYSVRMPVAAVPVHIGQQDGRVTVWAEVDPAARTATRLLQVVATGEAFDAVYLGTVQMPNGLVWHVVDFGEGGD